MKSQINFVIALIFVLSIIDYAYADDKKVKAQIEEICVALIQHIPIDKKVSIKSLSPEKTGLPENFLRKLTADLEAGLLKASDFEINLTNRLSTEEIWQEAIEFNNANFDDLYAVSNADIMLLLSPRAIGDGVEINITAYSLTGSDAGKVLASSGSVVLEMDIQKKLGVNVNNLNAQMAQVLSQIDKIGKLGGLVGQPNTYAEFYHNARLLQQRGEIDLAMANYERAITEGFLFVDPVLDLIDLATSRYGRDGTKMYFQKKIESKLPSELKLVVQIELGADPIEYVKGILDGEILFSPALCLWVKQIYSDRRRFDTLTVGKAIAQALSIISEDYKTAKFQKYFIDQIRGNALGQQTISKFNSIISSGQIAVDRMKISRTTVLFKTNDDGKTEVGGINIHDRVDLNKPIILCAEQYPKDGNEVCKSIDPSKNAYINRSIDWFGFNDTIPWTVGLICINSISYTDLNGFKVNSPVLVNREQREQYRPSDWKMIDECAGDYLRLRK